MSRTPRKRLTAVPPDGEGRAPARRTSTPTTAAAAAGGTHGPYSRPPRGVILPSERVPMLADVLQGVRLGAHDRRAVDWLCRQLDTPTFLALLGILQRARQAPADRAAAAGEGKDRG